MIHSFVCMYAIFSFLIVLYFIACFHPERIVPQLEKLKKKKIINLVIYHYYYYYYNYYYYGYKDR